MRLLTTLLLMALALAGCDSGASSKTLATAPTDFVYAELDIAELQAMMASGTLDSRTLTQAYIDRIIEAPVAPATGPAWRIHPVNGDDFPGSGYGASAVARYPSLTVPMGHSNGLPLGIVFMGKTWGEARLIALAYDYEQLTLARRLPTYPATIAALRANPTRAIGRASGGKAAPENDGIQHD